MVVKSIYGTLSAKLMKLLVSGLSGHDHGYHFQIGSNFGTVTAANPGKVVNTGSLEFFIRYYKTH